MAFSNFRRRGAAGSAPPAPIMDLDPPPVWPLPPVTREPWTTPTTAEAVTLVAEIVAAGTDAVIRAVHGVRVQRPLFHPETLLVEVLTRRPAAAGGFDGGTMLFALGPDYVALFDGTSPVVHAINGETPPVLGDAAALEAYLRFFGHVVCGEAGAFQIVADPADLPPFASSPVVDKIFDETLSEPVPLARDDAGNQDMAATLLYGATLFDVVFRVSAAGVVDIIEDDPIATDLPVGAFHIIDGTRRVLLPRPVAG